MNDSTESLAPLHDLLSQAVAEHTWQKLILSKYKGTDALLQKLTIRLIELKQVPTLSCVYHYPTQQITKNFNAAEGLNFITEQLGNEFKCANFYFNDQEAQCQISKKGKVLLKILHLKPVTAKISNDKIAEPNGAHDKIKKRYVKQDRPFLVGLGVTDSNHQVIPAMSRKWKQINKFVEIMSQAIDDARLINSSTEPASEASQNNKPISVVDFGSGKGYLTFAIHDYLTQALHQTCDVVGVELREQLTELCNQVVKQNHLTGLNFVCGDVKTHAPKQTDIMIALHACDIATDYAIEYGIRANASIIMCSPCCHKQIRPQMKAPEALKPLLQYGIHLGQEAEMLTDGIRALLLQAYGYETKVFEFVSLEHTSKNKMILAIKKSASKAKPDANIMQQVSELKNYYQVKEHCLEELLNAE